MSTPVRDRLRAVMIVLTGAALLLLLVTAVLVSAEVPPSVVGGKSDEVLIPSPPQAPASRLTSAAITTAFQADGWVQAFSDMWAPDESTDAEQYLDIAHSGFTLPVQVTNDEQAVGPPAVADYPIKTIVVVWAGPVQLDVDEGGLWNNIEYATFDVDGNLVLPITQVSHNEPPGFGIYRLVGDPVPAVEPTNGNVLFAWEHYTHLGPGVSWTEIYLAVRGPDGAEIKGASLITSTYAYVEGVWGPAAAAFANGSFLVAWSRQHSGDARREDIYYVVLNATGDILVSPTNLTGNPAGQRDRDVRATRLPIGHILLTWTGEHGLGQQVYYAVLSSAGRVVQAPSRLSDAPYGAGGSDAASLLNRNTIVAWEESGAQANESQIAYAMLNSTYTATLPLPIATKFLTNPLEAQNYAVSLARDGNDNALLTWQGSGGQNIYAAVVGNDGLVRTWPEILRAARGTSLRIDATGAGCGSLPRSVVSRAVSYLPLVLRND